MIRAKAMGKLHEILFDRYKAGYCGPNYRDGRPAFTIELIGSEPEPDSVKEVGEFYVSDSTIVNGNRYVQYKWKKD